MKRKFLSLAIIGVLILMLFSLTGCVGFLLYIYNNASEVVEANPISAEEINTFNSKFTQYEGNRISGNNVKSLLNSITQNNYINEGRQIKISGDVATNQDVKSTDTYKVEFEYGNDGFINKVIITLN